MVQTSYRQHRHRHKDERVYRDLDDEVIFLNASGGGFALNLPAAASARQAIRALPHGYDHRQRCYRDPNTGSETIDGSATFILKTKNDCIRIISNGSLWLMLAHTYDEGWQSFTPGVANWVTNTTTTGKYRRKGKCIDAQWNHALSGAPDRFTLILGLPKRVSSGHYVLGAIFGWKAILPRQCFDLRYLSPRALPRMAALNDADSFTVYKDDGDGTVSVVNAGL